MIQQLRNFIRRLKYAFTFEDWEYESCYDCGRNYRFPVYLTDKAWQNIVGDSNICLCMECILIRSEKINYPIERYDFRSMRLFTKLCYGKELVEKEGIK